MTPAALGAIGRLFAVAAAAGLAGCGGVQSALAPAGADAARIATLFWWMLGGATIIWFGVVGTVMVRGEPCARAGVDERRSRWLIIGGGVLFPVVVLAALLSIGLDTMPRLRAVPAGTGPTIDVAGERFWWRVRYRTPAGIVETANEIRLARGARIELTLSSPDVIHSFWIPNLAGKVDAIPGRINRIVVEPTRTGVFRGQCAEFCGTSHALMAFTVTVMEPAAHAAWLAAQARPAVRARGETLFVASGCGACHTVRGTAAAGRLGPDLTHIGSRPTIAAATLPNRDADLRRWIAHTGEVKPDVNMPDYAMLPAPEIAALAAYLKALT